MVFFAGVTAVQSTLIADCYISHDPERGVVRNRSYVDAVRLYLAISHAFPLLKFLPLSHLPIAGKKVNGAAVSRQALGFYLTSES
ncbi:unnamed protein product [Miscanthus lutarioriparius]|uniref:Uncharacterized protein n=1 Tax=Miscanthus lutarioriparius TaxID=422564 RepID=A0A811QMV3_9POAL|nr:unnamed protein product [Miscanthus lutarioriparius]